MIEETIIQALANLPFALILVYFLYLTFKQRQQTMEMMVKMVGLFTAVISSCCDEEKQSISDLLRESLTNISTD